MQPQSEGWLKRNLGRFQTGRMGNFVTLVGGSKVVRTLTYGAKYDCHAVVQVGALPRQQLCTTGSLHPSRCCRADTCMQQHTPGCQARTQPAGPCLVRGCLFLGCQQRQALTGSSVQEGHKDYDAHTVAVWANAEVHDLKTERIFRYLQVWRQPQPHCSTQSVKSAAFEVPPAVWLLVVVNEPAVLHATCVLPQVSPHYCWWRPACLLC